MNICICGGGALGTVCASIFSNNGHVVNLLTGHPENWRHAIYAIDEEGNEIKGMINIISSNAKEVIPTSDIILICVPGYLIEKILKEIRPYKNEHSIVGSVVSSTGFFFIAHDIFKFPTTLFGFQRVPYIARIKEYGKSAYLLGHKESLNVAIENYEDPYRLTHILQNLFQTKVNLLNDYLEVSLTNSNPLLHTARLYTMWKNKEHESFEVQSLFYGDWTEEASDLLLAMDKEFMTLISKLNITPGAIKSILEHYEVNDAKELTAKIKSIPAFAKIKSPMRMENEKWYPDLNSRYFTEDFPFGLRFIKNLAEEREIPIPIIIKVYEWGIHDILKYD